VLFYDPALSYNNTIACASCHHQQSGFSDSRQFSKGFSGKFTNRNSPSIFNLTDRSLLFWDMRENSLKQMVLDPVENHIEMGFERADRIVNNIQNIDYYAPLFQKAFNGSNVTEEKIRMALAEFLKSIKSGSSKYDEGVKIEFANYNQEEKRGRAVFEESGCENCHNGANFGNGFGWGPQAANIGLEMNYKDKGMSNVNSGMTAEGVFKVPSLRNVALTAPYMHDGRYATLDEVIEHYSSGIVDHPDLSWELKEFSQEKRIDGSFVFTVHPRRLNLSANDKKALIAFLNTLTDYSFTTAERFSNPFRQVK
jgi:cytochrome c peroxidase